MLCLTSTLSSSLIDSHSAGLSADVWENRGSPSLALAGLDGAASIGKIQPLAWEDDEDEEDEDFVDDDEDLDIGEEDDEDFFEDDDEDADEDEEELDDE
jgi:hypothetical protein